MTFLKSYKFSVFAGIFLTVLLYSCTEEPTTIGATVVGGKPFITDKATFDVFTFNKKIEEVSTNGLPLYQLGNFNDPIYGKTEAQITSQLRLSSSNPRFGNNLQSTEDNPTVVSQIQENEKVDSVILFIPYMTKSAQLRDSDGDGVDDIFEAEGGILDPNSDKDNDGITDNQERINGTDPEDPNSFDSSVDGFVRDNFAKKIDIDSIYGDSNNPFNLKVQRSTYFLRDLDPNSGFQEAQQYFSNQQFAPSFVSDVLFDGQVIVSDKEILLDVEDDVTTTDTDESEQKEKLNPGIRVKLDPAFFQTNFLDKEGSSELFSQANFSNFIRGLHFSINQDDNIMMLLDLRNANIEIFYNYQFYNTADSVEETRNSSYTLSLLVGNQFGSITGNAVNTLNNDTYPTTILDQLDNQTDNDASRIYLKGGAGSYAEIDLFDKDKIIGEDIVADIKANNWIINEANLVFHVDNIVPNDTLIPPRIYLYNAETGNLIFDPANDFSESDDPLGQYINYGGILEEDAVNGLSYKIRITDHINNMIVRDSTNATLGLVITPNVNLIGVRNAMLHDADLTEDEIPIANTLTPLGTVLFGSNVEPSNIEKKVKLEIFYTQAN